MPIRPQRPESTSQQASAEDPPDSQYLSVLAYLLQVEPEQVDLEHVDRDGPEPPAPDLPLGVAVLP